MAITLQCPRCTHEQIIDDDRAKGEMPCKICHHLISPIGAQTNVSPKAAPKPSKAAPSDEFQTGPPPVQGSKPPAVAKTKPAKSKRDDDDENEGKRRTPRRRATNAQSSVMTPVLLFGGGFLLISLLCAGGGAGAYFLLRTGNERPGPIVKVPRPQPIPVPNPEPFANPNPNPFPVPNPNPFPEPNPFPNPFPVPNPFPPPNPIPFPKPLNPNDPAEVDRVLTALQGPAPQRGPAMLWLSVADTKHPRRAEIAKQLDAMVDESLQQPFGSEPFFNAYFKWATKESTPALIRIIENTRFTGSSTRNRHEAMRMLAKAKEVSAAAAIAKRLPDHSDRGVATDCLIDLGPAAESVVLPTFNHPDHFTREAIRRVMLSYKTSTDKIVVQCIADLDSTEPNRRGPALQWLLKNPVEPTRKMELARALNKLMAPDNCLANRDLVVALETWGTSDNTPRLVELLDKTPFGNRDAIRVLGKIRDPKSVNAVAKHLSGPGFLGMEARNALKEFGPIAEPAVIEIMNTTNDARGRTECVRCLGDIGTKAVSIPALQAMALRLQQDRLFVLNVQNAVTMINLRQK